MSAQPHVPGLRITPAGRWELTLSHPKLHRGRVHRNFRTQDEAVAYRERMLPILKMDIIPAELTRAGVRDNPPTGPAQRSPTPAGPVATSKIGSQSVKLKELLRQYLASGSAHISSSTRPTLETLMGEVDGRLDGVRSSWVDAWVLHMKRDRRLAPGSIRKKVEALARAVDWWHRREYESGEAPPNILRLLPKGYSFYSDGDLPPGEPAPIDAKRDRRLQPREYDEIEAVLQGKKRENKESAWAGEDAADFLMLFRLIVHTGMRLREAYCLYVKHINPQFRTIHVATSKTGSARDVPMTRQLTAWLVEYIGDKRQEEIVFPYWAGSNDEDVLEAVTGRLSRRFTTLFRYCGCDDLNEHDLRHEATCRWVEKRGANGSWLYRSEEVMRITGHKSVQMFMRYLSLRGSDLADRLD